VEAGGKGVDTGMSAATTALGRTGILHGSKTILMQTEDGQVIEPYSISAGLDYPGIGPIHAHLYDTKRAIFVNITDEEAMQAGFSVSRLEGIIPAIETAHAFAALDKITSCKNKKGEKHNFGSITFIILPFFTIFANNRHNTTKLTYFLKLSSISLVMLSILWLCFQCQSALALLSSMLLGQESAIFWRKSGLYVTTKLGSYF
jgi:hypothetical protein